MRLALPMLDNLSKPYVGLDFGCGVRQAMAGLFRNKGHNCHCYDIFYYPDEKLHSRKYDFIIASEVIEHLYAPRVIFERWLAMLAPSGILGVMTGLRPLDKSFADWWYKNDPTHVMLFSKNTFNYLQVNYQLKCLYQQGNVLIFKKKDNGH